MRALKSLIVIFALALIQVSVCQAVEKDQIVRLKINSSLADSYMSLSAIWIMKIGMGPQFQEVVIDPTQSIPMIAVLRDNTEVPIEEKQLGFFFAGGGAGEDLDIFSSASLLFNNFQIVKEPNSNIGETPQGITRIYMIGATWCMFCKPRTGALLKYFGNSNRKVRSPYEIIYLEFSGNGNEIEGKIPIQQFLQAKALESGFGYPAVVIQKGKNFLPFRDAEAFLNQEVSGITPNQNLLAEVKNAKDFLDVSRIFMTSIFTDVGQVEIDLIRQYQLAGVLVYRRQAGVQSSSDLKTIFNSIQKTNQDSLFVAVDQEGGNVQRIMTTDTCKLPPAEVLEGKSEAQIRRFSEIMTRDLLRAGINMNFNPVLELKNPISQDITGWRRAISNNPQEVARVASIINSTLLENGILTVGKHLPGIGAAKNTHGEPAAIEGNYQSLKSHELVPFLSLMQSKAGLPGLMLGNVTMPAYDVTNPIAFSKTAIERFVRGDLGYQGLLINDGFHMDSSTAFHAEEQAPYYALLAGVAPIYVNSNFLKASIRFILHRLSMPGVPQSEKDAVRAALKSAYTRIKKVKSAMSANTPKLDLKNGCSRSDMDFLDQMVGHSNWRVNSR